MVYAEVRASFQQCVTIGRTLDCCVFAIFALARSSDSQQITAL
jgi:hypothetical protein